jgi:hypothetical protein
VPEWLIPYRPVIIYLPLLILALAANASLFLRYQRSDAITRRQIKMFVFIAVVGVMLLLAVEISKYFTPFFTVFLGGWFYGFILLIGWNGYPLAVGVSVIRYRLYDIDIIIRRTLVYGTLTASLALIFLGAVTLLQAIFSAVSGQQSAVSVVISTLLIAALFNPLRLRIQRVIDRRFYRSHYDAEKTLQRFAHTVRIETDLDALSTELLAVVQETLQPESVSIWLMPSPGAKYPRES